MKKFLDWLDRLLGSPRLRNAGFIISGLAGVSKLVALAFPESDVVQQIARACLFLLGSYLVVVLVWALVRGCTALLHKQFLKWLPQARGESANWSTPLLSGAELAFRHYAKRYGISYHLMQVECSIREDGSALVQRRVTLEAYSEVSELDTFLVIPESARPRGKERDIDNVGIRSATPGWEVSPIRAFEESGRLYTEIPISPPLKEGQSITYELTEKLPPGLYAIGLSKKQLATRETPEDYFAWNISRPTRKLTLKVFFPEGVKPTVHGVEVRYASAAAGFPSKRSHYEEKKRLERPFLGDPEGGRYVLKLDVDYPMIGLVYFLNWQPVPKTTGAVTELGE